jgi:hypothetical protein
VRSKQLRTAGLEGTELGVEFTMLPPEPEVAEQTTALVGALRFTGYGTAQYMVSGQATSSLCEVNPRMGISIGWTGRSGIDPPLAALRLATGDWHPPEGWVHPVGRKTVWTSRDVYSMRLALRRGEIDRVGALRWLWQTTRAFVRADDHLTYDRGDPIPTVALFAHLAKVMVRPPDA